MIFSIYVWHFFASYSFLYCYAFHHLVFVCMLCWSYAIDNQDMDIILNFLHCFAIEEFSGEIYHGSLLSNLDLTVDIGVISFHFYDICRISVTFVDKDGEEKHIKVPLGMSMLEAAHENDIELEGACEGSLACSTCHVIVMDMEHYNKLEDPTDEENDMLDLAFGLTETSRLGCQVIAKPELDGIRLAIPAATRNFAVDGYVPKPH
eukprot:XP_025012609.1 uncharacterized protein LOC8259057 isoform X1 [Ricinus communis]